MHEFVPSQFSKTKNLIPIAILNLRQEGIEHKIPVSYSMMQHGDSTNFLVKGDYCEKYSFTIDKDGRFRPLFLQKALAIPDD